MTILHTLRSPAARHRPSPLARLALAAGVLMPLLAPAQAQAFGRGWQPGYQRLPVQRTAPLYLPQQRVIYDDPTIHAYAGQQLGYNAEERARRCNQGRLVGGLMGGSAGYVLANGRDRVWATPLGALLGSQIGCNAVQGNAPLPW